MIITTMNIKDLTQWLKGLPKAKKEHTGRK